MIADDPRTATLRAVIRSAFWEAVAAIFPGEPLIVPPVEGAMSETHERSMATSRTPCQCPGCPACRPGTPVTPLGDDESGILCSDCLAQLVLRMPPGSFEWAEREKES